jgi:hypothetical protein
MLMEPEDFIRAVKRIFRFLISEYEFDLKSAEISKRFDKPMIIFEKDDLQMKIAEARGSVKVFARILGEIDLGFTFGEVIYFLDEGILATDRVYGYGPDPEWDKDHDTRLIEQMTWYSKFIQENLQRVLELLYDDDQALSLERLVHEKRQKLTSLQRVSENNESEDKN